MQVVLALLTASLADRYRIERELGAGGMATVYLAHDLRHGRDVAIKVLHPELGLALGAERFLAEIRTTARLQHPHILPLLDSGDIGDGLLYYVMPLATGESLRDRLTRERQLPIEDAVRIAREVGSALQYAHEQGIIHRDIKPENILLQGGHALVADFGIALAVQQAGGARMTQTGLSLGTPSYMSPEQAVGERTIDARSDVYALGAMTYEMLTGDPPFTGGSVQAIVAKVMSERPVAPSVVRDTISPGVEEAVMRALAKLPADRFATARAFVEALERPTTGGVYASRATPVAGTRGHSTGMRVALAVLGLAALASAAGWWRAANRVAPREPVHFAIDLPDGLRIVPEPLPFAVSHDGRMLAIAAVGRDGRRQLYLRRLADASLHPIEGTEGAGPPTFSPNDSALAFVSGGRLRSVPVAGGSATTLAEVGDVTGMSWGAGGFIFVASDGRLAVVPEGGGSLRRLEGGGTPPGLTERYPVALSDGKSVLFTAWPGGTSGARVMRRTIDPGPAVPIGFDSVVALGVGKGWILGAGAGALRLAPVDDDVSRLTAAPRQVLDGVASILLVPLAAVSASGTLLHVPGSDLADLVRIGPGGDTAIVSRDARAYMEPRFSPDGRRIAAAAVGREGIDIWVLESDATAAIRLTNDGRRNGRPEWSPDGRHVLFRAERDSVMAIWWQKPDGAEPAEVLHRDPRADLWEGVLSPDGAWLLYRQGSLGTADIHVRGLAGDSASRPFAASAATEVEGRFSPDGRWVAYTSNQSGSFQVYVRPFPSGDARHPISVAGGEMPIWSADGRAIFYTGATGSFLIRARLALEPGFAVAARDTIIRGGFYLPRRNGHAMYDVGRDGSLLLVRRRDEGASPIVSIGWIDEVRSAREQ